MNLSHDDVRDLAAGFVLGALEPDEEQAVREHLATCPEPHDEFAALGGVVAYLGETVEPVEPPAELKGRIMAAAAAELEARQGADARAGAGPTPAERVPEPAPPVPPEEPEQPLPAFPAAAERAERARRRAGPITWLARIAAVLVIVALGAWNLLLQGQLTSAQDYDRAVAAVLDVAARPGSQTAILSGEGGQGPRGIAAVGADGAIVIAMRDLSPTTGAQVYEAWVIAGGAPVPIGGFTAGQNGIGTLTVAGAPVGTGITLALTREPGPGATAPTLPIVSSGVATAPPS